jgi:hypothetical protein
MFITLLVMAFGFVIGLSWYSHKSSQGAFRAKNSTLPPASVVPPRPEIASNSGGKSLPTQNPVETSLFPATAKPKAIAGNPLARNLPPESTTSSGDVLSPESPAGEQPTISFGVSPTVSGKIIKKITPLDQQKVIALTFDDGPWPSNTLKILEILKKNNIKATFFWVGQALKEHPQIGKQVVAEGSCHW